MTVRVIACGLPGAVDLVDTRAGAGTDPIHMSAAEWAEFLAAVKAGTFDKLAMRGHDPAREDDRGA